MFNAIEKRRSIRNYQKDHLSKDDKNQVIDILKSMENEKGPFNHQARFFYKENEKDNGKTYGTYGFIKNPPAFIGGVTQNNQKAMVDYGFLFEHIILKLTEMGLGTVWLGGTFHRDEFDVPQGDNEIIPAISPVGYPKYKSIREKVIRRFAKADQRIDFDELFFEGEDLEFIPPNHPYHAYLKAVQIGPSASNKQPWRIVLINNTFHFYLDRTDGYGNKLNFDIQSLDIGIAIAHLCLTLKEDGISYTFINDDGFNYKDKEYIISVKLESSS